METFRGKIEKLSMETFQKVDISVEAMRTKGFVLKGVDIVN